MDADELNRALQAEYLHIQKTIEDFDGRALVIKAWSVTFGMAAISSAFVAHSTFPFLAAFIGSGTFWLLEAQWKVFQLSYYERSNAIEAHFRNEKRLEYPFQIGGAWYTAWKRIRKTEIRRVWGWLHVALPHLIVVLMSATLYLMSIMGVMSVHSE